MARSTRSALPALDNVTSLDYDTACNELRKTHGLKLGDVCALAPGESLSCVILLQDSTLMAELLKRDSWFAREAFAAVASIEITKLDEPAHVAAVFTNGCMVQDFEYFPLHVWNAKAMQWQLACLQPFCEDDIVGWNGAFVVLQDVPADLALHI